MARAVSIIDVASRGYGASKTELAVSTRSDASILGVVRMDGRLRRRMEQHLRQLNVRIPAPFSAEMFSANLAQARGREIHLVPWDTTGATVPCGLWISTSTADYIIFEQAVAPILRDHIILHELCHLLLGHAGGLSLENAGGLFDIINPETVKQVLGRDSAYDAREERDAEVFASVIGDTPPRHGTNPVLALDDADAAVLDRFGAALAGDRTWRV
jgi:hypothetical protein